MPAGTYDDLVMTADTTALEPDVLEHEFYAAGTGLVLTVDEGTGHVQGNCRARPWGLGRIRRQPMTGRSSG